MLRGRCHHVIPNSPSSFFTLEGIIINDTNSIVPSAFSYFETSAQPEGETIDYKGIAGLGGANIWIILDGDSVKDITMEYREMRGLGLRAEITNSIRRPTMACRSHAATCMPSEGKCSLAYPSSA